MQVLVHSQLFIKKYKMTKCVTVNKIFLKNILIFKIFLELKQNKKEKRKFCYFLDSQNKES